MSRIHRPLPLTLALLCALTAAPAAADSLVVKGDTLRGKVANLGADGVVFDPVYGAGTLTVPWADVEGIESDEPVTVLFGEEGELRGRLLGLDAQGALLVGSDPASAQAVETAQLFEMFDGEVSSLRSRFRHWTASFDAGGSFTDATTDRISGTLGTRVEFANAPFHWLLEGGARFSEQKDENRSRDVTENLQFLFSRGEYDIVPRVFGFGSLRLTRDTVQELSLRTEPKAGLGARLIERETFKLSADVGAAFVDEDFSGGRRSSFWAVAFGAQSEAQLPYGAIWRARAEYVPSVTDWTEDYLLRGSTELDFPLLGWLSFVLSAVDEYDSTPADDTQHNRFTTSAALRARFP